MVAQRQLTPPPYILYSKSCILNVRMIPLKEYSKLVKTFSLEHLFIDRQDLNNPSGSHKDLIIGNLILYYRKKNKNQFVISSSGNAAISAAYAVKNQPSIILHIFISSKINEDKKKRLEDEVKGSSNIHIYRSLLPKKEAWRLAKERGFQILRTSTDDMALEGYKSIGIGLLQQIAHNIADKEKKRFNEVYESMDTKDIALFIPTSSGTLIQGIYEDFKNAKINPIPQLHIVQTTKVAPMAREFDKDFKPSKTSKASAIVDTIAHRKIKVLEAVRESKGSGWVIGDKELVEAKKLLEETTDIKGASWDSLLALAGLMKAEKSGKTFKNVILIFTGK